MKHWLETVVVLLTAETADLRKLALIAGGDPRTFYVGVRSDRIDFSGQDVSGMEFDDPISENRQPTVTSLTDPIGESDKEESPETKELVSSTPTRGASETALQTISSIFGIVFNPIREYRRRREAERIRYEVEDLARQLMEARDDALRKRFKAEVSDASKTAFVANVSHELRNPLNSVIGLTSLLLSEKELPPRFRGTLEAIQAAGTSMHTFVAGLTDYPAIESGTIAIGRDEIDIRKFVGELVERYSSISHRKGVQLREEISLRASKIITDRSRLDLVLSSLLDNAIIRSSEGYVEIKVSYIEARKGRYLKFEVLDRGRAIVPWADGEDAENYFKLMESHQDRAGGISYIQLGIVFQIVKALGGRMGALITREYRNNFWFEIPERSERTDLTQSV
jgi:signal transduction histidine kinase